MRTALDAPTEALDADEQSFVALIREHGWFETRVPMDDEGPGFSYTTGFWVNIRQPELIIFGAKGEIAHDMFWELFRGAREGPGITIGVRLDGVFSNLPAYAFPVATRHYAEYLGWSRWFYAGDDFPCLQIVWPDRAGHFLWEDAFDPLFASNQPDITESGWRASLAN